MIDTYSMPSKYITEKHQKKKKIITILELMRTSPSQTLQTTYIRMTSFGLKSCNLLRTRYSRNMNHCNILSIEIPKLTISLPIYYNKFKMTLLE